MKRLKPPKRAAKPAISAKARQAKGSRRGPRPESSAEPYAEIKKMLERQRQALLAEAGYLLERASYPTAEAPPDRIDQAASETDQNFMLRLREREQQLLKKIDESIARIDGKTFGICEMCGGQISLQRLRARPVTTLCIACKTQQEQEEKIRQA